MNKSLQGLPTDSFPADTYVWMNYALYDFKYPSEDYESDDTQYHTGPFTKWPDFTNAEEAECGGALDYVSITGVSAEEGLCVFVRSPYLTAADDLLTVRFSYNDGVTATGENPTMVGVFALGQGFQKCLYLNWLSAFTTQSGINFESKLCLGN